jgi:hypothetical protein
MSASQLRLSSHILKEHYGEIVEKVGLNILRKGWTTIASIKQDTGLAISKVLYTFYIKLLYSVLNIYSFIPHPPASNCNPESAVFNFACNTGELCKSLSQFI